MANNAKSILARIGIGGFLLMLIGAGVTLGVQSVFFKPKVEIQETVVYVDRDTCYQRDSMILISKDSFALYELREGETKVIEQSPSIDYVRESTSEDDVKVTGFSKTYDMGLTSADISFEIRHTGDIEIDSWVLEYRTDTILAREMYETTNTIVLPCSKQEITVVPPDINVPELLPRKKNIIGASGGLVFTDKLFYSVGGYITTKRDITFKGEKFINSQGGEIELLLPLSKIFNK